MAKKKEKRENKAELSQYYKIVYSPIVTEKSTKPKGPAERDEDGKAVKNTNRPTFAFWVSMNANKVQIREAIERIFEVKVEKVATMVIKRKPYRSRWWKRHEAPKKKAIVTLAEGDMLDFF